MMGGALLHGLSFSNLDYESLDSERRPCSNAHVCSFDQFMPLYQRVLVTWHCRVKKTAQLYLYLHKRTLKKSEWHSF